MFWVLRRQTTFTRIFIPPLAKSDVKMAGILAVRRLCTIGLEIEEYHASHGHYPASSSDIQANWNDPFSGTNLVYKLEKQGFIVYSVAEDGKDNGGLERRRGPSNEWDIVFKVSHAKQGLAE
jgi:hypothetical protein